MKKYLVLLLVAFTFQLNAQVNNDQWTIITKKAADWCSNCGGWAWPVFKDIVTDMEDKNAITIAMHHTGGLMNPTSEALTDNFGGNYQPEFFLNNDIQNVTLSNASQARTEIIEQVDFLSASVAYAGVSLDAYVDPSNSQLAVHSTVRFFEDLSGTEYYLGLYLIQNNIVHQQAGQGMVAHPRLLTGRFTSEAFGDMLDPSNLGDQEFNHAIGLPADFDIEETEIVAIIWLKDSNGVYRVFNANIQEEINLILSDDNLQSDLSEVRARFASDQLLLNFETANSISEMVAQLTDLNGREIYRYKVNDLNSGKNMIVFEAPNIASGIYVLSIIADNKNLSKKVFRR